MTIIKKHIQNILFAIGRHDCSKGKKSRFSFQSYINGYGYQYEKDQFFELTNRCG